MMANENMEPHMAGDSLSSIRVENGTIRANGLITQQRADQISVMVGNLKQLVSATLRGHRVITTGRDLPDVSMRLLRNGG